MSYEEGKMQPLRGSLRFWLSPQSSSFLGALGFLEGSPLEILKQATPAAARSRARNLPPNGPPQTLKKPIKAFPTLRGFA